MLRALALSLAILAPPAALAGAVQLSPSDAGASGPVSEQDWLQRFLDRIDGLDRPLFTVEGDAPACAPGTRGVTRALLIAAGRSVEVEQGWLDGPDNDVALIARSLGVTSDEIRARTELSPDRARIYLYADMPEELFPVVEYLGTNQPLPSKRVGRVLYIVDVLNPDPGPATEPQQPN